MPSTGNTQQQINYGATANDGTGDPLRTAFVKTDENFDNIWLAGPVGSNVTIVNNNIQANDTNGNIVIKPNGVGVIQANAHIVPNMDSARDLGTANLAWRRIYVDTLNTADLAVTGNLDVSGNLTVDGDIIQIGNLVTDAKTIQLANTAATDAAADGSGITVGASDDVATLLYNSTNNEWRTNIGANIAGNITGTYFIGNGSQLTGITSYANANAVAYGEAGWAGNLIPSGNGVYSLGNATNYWSNLWVANNTIYIGGVPLGVSGNVLTVNGEPVLSNDSDTAITTTGNITADYFIGNGSQLTGLPEQYGNANVAAYLPTYTGNITAGNITANYFIGDGSLLTGISSTGNITFSDTTISAPDDESMTLQVRDVDEAVRSSLLLDSNDGLTRWSSLSSEQETSYNTGDWSTATWTGNSLDFVDAPNIVAFVDTGDYNGTVNKTFSINGGTRLPYDGASYGGNNISFSTTVAADPDPTTVTTIAFYYQFQSQIQMDHDNSEILIQAQDMDIQITGDDDIRIQAADNIDIEASGSIDIDSNEQIDIRSYSITDPVRIITDASTSTTIWAFGADGTLTTPGDITVGGDITGTAAANTLVVKAQPTTDTYIQLNSIVDSTVSIFANLDIVTDSSNTAQTFTFGTDGVLTLPNGGEIDNDGNNIELRSTDNINFEANSDLNIYTDNGSSQWTFGSGNTLTLPGGTAVIDSSDDNIELRSNNNINMEAVGAINVYTDNGNNQWQFGDDGVLTAPGNIAANYFVGNGSALTGLTYNQTGNIVGDQANVILVAGSYNTVFDNTGNVTLPGNLVFSDNSKFSSAAWTLVESPPPIDFNSGSTQMVQLGNTPATLVANYNELYIRLQGPDASNWRTSTIIPSPDISPNSTVSLGTIPNQNTGDSKIIFDVLSNANILIQMSVNSGRYGNIVIYGR